LKGRCHEKLIEQITTTDLVLAAYWLFELLFQGFFPKKFKDHIASKKSNRAYDGSLKDYLNVLIHH